MDIFSIFGRHKPDLRVIIDVGSNSIKAVVFEVSSRSKHPKIIRKMIYRLPSQSSPDRVALKLREFLFEMVKNIGRIPRKIIAAIGPNLADSALDIWTNSGVEISKSIGASNLKSWFEKLTLQNQEEDKILISHPTEVFINGYAVTDFFSGYKNQDREIPKEIHLDVKNIGRAEISFRVFRSYFKEKIGAILEGAKKSLGGMPIEFIPLAIAYKGVASSALKLIDALLIDMGGERTSLSFLKNGEVIQFSAFPLGARHFVRGIAEIASVSFEEAETESRQYVQGLVKEGKRAQLNDFLVKEAALWEREFNHALEDFFTLGPLPNKVLLFGGGANFPEIVSILKKPDWIKNISYAETPEVRVLKGENIFDGNKFGGIIMGPEEVGLASLLHYALYYEPIF